MYLVLIAWFYVALMMAVAEATSPVGTVLGAVFTFLLYGALPMLVVGYIMGTPARKRARLAREAAQAEAEHSALPSDAHSATPSDLTPDGNRETARDPITPIRKEP